MGINSTSGQAPVRRSTRTPKKRERSLSAEPGHASGGETPTGVKRSRGESPDVSWSPGRASSSPQRSTSPWPPLMVNGQAMRIERASAARVAPAAEAVPPIPSAPAAALPIPSAPAAALPPQTLPLLPFAMPIGAGQWWKMPSAAPGYLHNVHLASPSESLFGTWARDLPRTPVYDKLRLAAHEANCRLAWDFLSSAALGLQRFEVHTFGVAFDALESPTIEQFEKKNEADMIIRQARLHSAVHAVVGIGSVQDKVRTLYMLGAGQPALLPDIRMGDHNLLHLACMAPMNTGDRALLIDYLKSVGVDPAARDAQGMTPLHYLATVPDTTPATMEALSGWAGSSDIAFNARNNAGETPLLLAIRTQLFNADLSQWMMERGARVQLYPRPTSPAIRRERVPLALQLPYMRKDYQPIGEPGPLVVPQ